MTNPISQIDERPEEYSADNAESLEEKYGVEVFRYDTSKSEKDSSDLFSDEVNKEVISSDMLFTEEITYKVDSSQTNKEINNLLLVVVFILIAIIMHRIINMKRRDNETQNKSNS